MNKLKQRHSQMDFGFYAAIPRIVRTEYPEISPAQKWFYVCLKDLAGDDGTCYRTIRTLAKATGLSCGLISESIPVLHTTGLIHAEKKKRQTGGKEVWHLTIVDIWQKNGEIHPAKRSQGEQRETTQDAHRMDVQVANKPYRECSLHECSASEPEERTEFNSESKNNSEGRTKRVKRIQSAAPGSFSASAYALPSASADQHIIQLDERRSRDTDEAGRVGDEKSVSTPKLSTNPTTFPQKQGKTASRQPVQGDRSQAFQASLEAALSEEARAIYTAWCSLFTVPMPLTPATAKAAEALVKPLAGWCSARNTTLAELLKEIMHWLYATDKTGYYRRGVKLSDVAREFEGWQSAKERDRHTPDEGTASLPEKGEVFWRGRWMSYAEADDQGWNGGFGEFVHHTTYA